MKVFIWNVYITVRLCETWCCKCESFYMLHFQVMYLQNYCPLNHIRINTYICSSLVVGDAMKTLFGIALSPKSINYRPRYSWCFWYSCYQTPVRYHALLVLKSHLGPCFHWRPLRGCLFQLWLNRVGKTSSTKADQLACSFIYIYTHTRIILWI